MPSVWCTSWKMQEMAQRSRGRLFLTLGTQRGEVAMPTCQPLKLNWARNTLRSCFCETELSCHQASVASGRDEQSSVGWKLGEQMSLLRASYAQRFVFFCLDTVHDHHVPGLTLHASGCFPEWHLLSCSVYFLGFSAVMVKSNGQNEQGGEWTGVRGVGWGDSTLTCGGVGR